VANCYCYCYCYFNRRLRQTVEQLQKAAELPPAQLQSLADRSRTLTEQLSAARRQLAEEAGERAALRGALLEEQGRAARRDQQLRAEQQRACGDALT
jgi:hypothetical protein